MIRKLRLPSPALVVACIALIVALSGTAVAAGIVANARHANKADLATRALNADKVGGKTAVQIAASGTGELRGRADHGEDRSVVVCGQWKRRRRRRVRRRTEGDRRRVRGPGRLGTSVGHKAYSRRGRLAHLHHGELERTEPADR